LSANDIGESRLINAYRLQAIARFSAVLPSNVALLRSASRGLALDTLNANNIDESRLLDNYRWQAIERFYSTYGGR
jgi:hypothetical protein